MSCSITDHEASTQTLALRSQLEESFGAQLDIYRFGGEGWQRLTAASVAGAETIASCSNEIKYDPENQLTEWLEELAAQPPTTPPTTPQIKSLGRERAMLAAWSVGDDGSPEVVAGQVDLNALQLAQSAAALAARSVETAGHVELLDQYAARLSASFEELSFLRRLSKHVELCMADRTLAEITVSVLPSLRELIGVEALCLISAETDSGSGRLIVGGIEGLVGDLPFPLEFWQEMIDGLAQRMRQVVVRNFFSQLSDSLQPQHQQLRSLVLAPVQKDDQTFGWLLAVNKIADSHAEVIPTNSLGHEELGTMEASLLEAAALMLGSHAANHKMFREMELLVVDVIHTLVGVVEAKDAYTCGHSHRVAMIARRLAEQMKLTDSVCEEIYSAGLLHDIGKIGVVDDVLLKPGKLTEEEFTQIKQHPVIGARLLKGLRPLAKLLPGVLHHHEAIDGSGYPHGLTGENIPLVARVLAVADAWDAMTSDRPYRPGMSIERASSILREGAGKQWDAEVVGALLECLSAVIEVNNLWQAKMSHFCLISNRNTVDTTSQPSTCLTPQLLS